MSGQEKEIRTDLQQENMTPGDGAQSASSEKHSSSERHSHHHHHHHHRHHRSHHHNRQSRSKKKNTRRAFKQFLRKNRKKLIFLSIALLFCVCSIAAGTFMDNIVHWRDGGSATPSLTVTEGQLRIAVSVFDQPVSIVNSAAQALLDASEDTAVRDVYQQYSGQEVRLDRGQPVKLSYSISGAPQGYMVAEAVFSVADNEQMTAPMRLVPEKGQESVECVNLKSGTVYYYRLDITFTNGVKSAVLGSFTTEPGLRMITVDGGYNMRDVGGWIATNGKRVRQGLLYRGCELDGAVEPKYTLTDLGKSTMLTVLNIKTDMDLRTQTEVPDGTDALGQNVKHVYYNVPMYTAVFNEQNKETMRRIFADLADPANYPAYLHCTYGQDRTGTVCYLLGALLGVDKADLMKDYDLSGLHHGNVSTDEMNTFVRRINELPGTTLSEKVEGYLLDVGVTSAQVQSIRDIFLEEAQ